MDNCTQLTKQERENALYAMGFVGLAATIVCLTAIVLVLVFKFYRYFAYRLALYQVLGALGYAVALTLQLLFLHLVQRKYGYIQSGL